MIERLLLATCLLFVPTGAIKSSPTGYAQSSVSYRVMIDGKPAGVEVVRTIDNEAGRTVRSNSEMIVNGVTRRIETVSEIKDKKLTGYSVDVTEGGDRKKYSVMLTGRRARVRIEANNRTSERLIPIHEDVMFLDSNVWHHYAQLLARYNTAMGGTQRFFVLVPQATLRELVVEIRPDGQTTYRSGSSKIKAQRFLVLPAGSEVRLIADESNRLVAIEVPALDTKVTID